MSKKTKLYILILINLIAWGYVGYRIYSALLGDDDIAYEQSNIPIKKINDAKVEDSVILLLNYADPFLKGGSYAKENKIKTYTPSKQVKTSKSNKTETVPATLDIKYIGLVKNNDKGTQTALISINGKSYFVKQNDITEGLKIKLITSESIVIIDRTNKLVIKKQ